MLNSISIWKIVVFSLYTVDTLYKNTVGTVKNYSNIVYIPIWYKIHIGFMDSGIENIFLYSVYSFIVYSCMVYPLYCVNQESKQIK